MFITLPIKWYTWKKVKEIMENLQENSAGINDDVSLFSQILNQFQELGNWNWKFLTFIIGISQETKLILI